MIRRCFRGILIARRDSQKYLQSGRFFAEEREILRDSGEWRLSHLRSRSSRTLRSMLQAALPLLAQIADWADWRAGRIKLQDLDGGEFIPLPGDPAPPASAALKD